MSNLNIIESKTICEFDLHKIEVGDLIKLRANPNVSDFSGANTVTPNNKEEAVFFINAVNKDSLYVSDGINDYKLMADDFVTLHDDKGKIPPNIKVTGLIKRSELANKF